MGSVQAMRPLEVRVCGAIRPSGRVRMDGAVVRHFLASGVVVFNGRLAWLSKRENQVMNAVVADQGRSQLATMLTFVGESDEDGGPEDVLGVTQVTLGRLKEKLRTIGLDLVRDGHALAPLVLQRCAPALVAEVA